MNTLHCGDGATLVDYPPSIVAGYLKEHSNEIALESEFNWLLVAEVAASNANDASLPQADALSWAWVAVTVYDKLKQDTTSKNASNSFSTKAMHIRVNMILTYGEQGNENLCDPRLVEEWFFRELDYTMSEAAELLATWATVPPKEQFQLLYLELRFQVVERLLDGSFCHRSTELHAWRELLNRQRNPG
ncbi:MAG: hypothetical protein C0467_18660 [Planctomycetaceae bacterium]|nr:hypothetical protein [Planctomycetaceae bacterium]